MASIKTTGIPFAPQDYGIKLGVFPSSDARFGVQVDISTNSSTGPWRPLKGLTPAGGQWNVVTDYLPNDGQRRYYRARHTAQGYDPSTNIVVSALPARILPGQRVEVPAFTGIGVPVDIYLSSANAVRVGSAGNSGAILKPLAISGMTFHNEHSTRNRDVSNGFYLQLASSDSTEEDYRTGFILAPGVNIRKFGFRAWRTTTDAQIRLQLLRTTTLGAAIGLGTLLSHTSTITTAPVYVESSQFAHTVSTNFSYGFELRMGGGGGFQRFIDAVVFYEMSEYRQAV
jgi:hypothetical protein